MSEQMEVVARDEAAVERVQEGERVYLLLHDLVMRPWPNPENILAVLDEVLPGLEVSREQAVKIGMRLGQLENRDCERIMLGSQPCVPTGPFLINRYAPLYRRRDTDAARS